MDLISKQEYALKFLSEKLNSEIENLKRKLEKFEKETLLKGAKVNSGKKDTDKNHPSGERNRGDTLGDQITMPDKTKDNKKIVQTKPSETICVNQVDRKENCSECSQSNMEPKEYTIKLFQEFNTLNTFGHIQCIVCQEHFTNNKDLILHANKIHQAVEYMEKKLGLRTCLNVKHKYQ